MNYRIRLLVLIAVLPLLIIGYGYLDAYYPTKIAEDVDIRAMVVTPMGLYIDTQPAMLPYEPGQLFARVTWKGPLRDRKRLASMRVWGDLTEGEGEDVVAKFDGPCMRGDSDWLADPKWEKSEFPQAYVCWVKLPKVLEMGLDNDGRLQFDQADARAANMRLRFYATPYAVNRPMRFVTWINEKAAGLLYPFTRA